MTDTSRHRRGLVLVVYGQPSGKGSLRHVGHGRLIEDNPKVRPWRLAVCEAAMNQDVANLDGALEVAVTLTVARPKSTRSAWPATRFSGDVDKHLRTIFDALQDAAVITDDSRIVQVSAVKTYPGATLDSLDSPGAVITVRELE